MRPTQTRCAWVGASGVPAEKDCASAQYAGSKATSPDVMFVGVLACAVLAAAMVAQATNERDAFNFFAQVKCNVKRFQTLSCQLFIDDSAAGTASVALASRWELQQS
jgi:hypothetical protein